jgi:hypothetical protein
MANANEFRQYAEEALEWASQSKTEEEKRSLIELACTWARAAAEVERPVAPNYRSNLSAAA